MENKTLGNIIVEYLSSLKIQFEEKLNLEKDRESVSLSYNCEAGNKIRDELEICVRYFTKESDERHHLTIKTDSVSIIYIDKIVEIIKNMMSSELRTKEEAENKLEELYNKTKEFYYIEFVKFRY